MFMLNAGDTLADVPELGGKLTQWHVHDNLCFSGPRVAGLTDADGNCAPGLTKGAATPMIHVWIEPHPLRALRSPRGRGRRHDPRGRVPALRPRPRQLTIRSPAVVGRWSPERRRDLAIRRRLWTPTARREQLVQRRARPPRRAIAATTMTADDVAAAGRRVEGPRLPLLPDNPRAAGGCPARSRRPSSSPCVDVDPDGRPHRSAASPASTPSSPSSRSSPARTGLWSVAPARTRSCSPSSRTPELRSWTSSPRPWAPHRAPESGSALDAARVGSPSWRRPRSTGSTTDPGATRRARGLPPPGGVGPVGRPARLGGLTAQHPPRSARSPRLR